MRDLREWRPIGRPRIERIEDHIAALGPVIMRDELAAGVIDQGRFAPRLDLVEHLAQHRGLAAPGCAQNGKVAAFEPFGNTDGGDAERCLFRRPLGQPPQLPFGDDLGATDDLVQRRLASAIAHPDGEAEAQAETQQPAKRPADDGLALDVGPALRPERIIGEDARGQSGRPATRADIDLGIRSAVGDPCHEAALAMLKRALQSRLAALGSISFETCLRAASRASRASTSLTIG